MIIGFCAFTEAGKKLTEKIEKALPDCTGLYRTTQPLTEWTGDLFERRLPIVFVGAMGIAIRAIAPFVEDKFYDSPVIVIDEKGSYVIPVLAGHLGGANALAKQIAQAIGANAVLTTATDVEEVFAVDEFAKAEGLRIVNREGIRMVSSKLLRNEEVTVSVDADVCITTDELRRGRLLTLIPRDLVLGIGCKKGTEAITLREFVHKTLTEAGFGDYETRLWKIASIDLKKNEPGLAELAQYLHVPFETYSDIELAAVEGDFSESAFVEAVTGVSCVCERAAVLAAGGELLQKKVAENGMTLALAKRRL